MAERTTPRPGASREGTPGTLAVTAAAAPLGPSQRCTAVLVQAAGANTETVLVGLAAAQTIELDAGDVITLPVQNVNQIYAKTSTGTAALNWLALYGE